MDSPSGMYGQPYTQSPPPRRRGRAGFWIALILALFFFCCTMVLLGVVILVTASAVGEESATLAGKRFVKQTISGSGEDEILLIQVRGIITGEPSRELFRFYPGSVQFINTQLQEAAKDSQIKAVILDIDSPGGAITACDVIHNQLLRFRDGDGINRGKPIVAYLGDTAASGGYYIACASDEIIAHETCLTGSIGVIMPQMSFEGLFRKLGIKVDPVKSAPEKDIGSPYRDMGAEERKYLQSIVDELQKRFVKVVGDGLKHRGHDNITDEQLKKVANGAPLTGRRARELSLVDSNGYIEDAVRSATKRAGLAKARVVTYARPPGFLDTLLGGDVEMQSAAPPQAKGGAEQMMLNQWPQFFYLWTAGRGIMASSAEEVPLPDAE
jgi:protease IV